MQRQFDVVATFEFLSIVHFTGGLLFVLELHSASFLDRRWSHVMNVRLKVATYYFATL